MDGSAISVFKLFRKYQKVGGFIVLHGKFEYANSQNIVFV